MTSICIFDARSLASCFAFVLAALDLPRRFALRLDGGVGFGVTLSLFEWVVVFRSGMVVSARRGARNRVGSLIVGASSSVWGEVCVGVVDSSVNTVCSASELAQLSIFFYVAGRIK